jgi:hypothetical protein
MALDGEERFACQRFLLDQLRAVESLAREGRELAGRGTVVVDMVNAEAGVPMWIDLLSFYAPRGCYTGRFLLVKSGYFSVYSAVQ